MAADVRADTYDEVSEETILWWMIFALELDCLLWAWFWHAVGVL